MNTLLTHSPSPLLLSLLSASLLPLADIIKLPSILSERHHKSINLNNAKHFIPASISFSIPLSNPSFMSCHHHSLLSHTSNSIIAFIQNQQTANVFHSKETQSTQPSASEVIQSQMILVHFSRFYFPQTFRNIILLYPNSEVLTIWPKNTCQNTYIYKYSEVDYSLELNMATT